MCGVGQNHQFGFWLKPPLFARWRLDLQPEFTSAFIGLARIPVFDARATDTRPLYHLKVSLQAAHSPQARPIRHVKLVTASRFTSRDTGPTDEKRVVRRTGGTCDACGNTAAHNLAKLKRSNLTKFTQQADELRARLAG
jgi:hypothetical protein